MDIFLILLLEVLFYLVHTFSTIFTLGNLRLCVISFLSPNTHASIFYTKSIHTVGAADWEFSSSEKFATLGSHNCS